MSVPDQDQEIELNSLERNNVEQPICSELQVVKVHSDRLNLDFTVYVQDQTLKTQQRCYIMTVHDLGCDCKYLWKHKKKNIFLFMIC